MSCRPSCFASLQEGEYERVGEEKVRQVDARIIAATNRDLQKEVEAGRFREDLYFRLNVFPIIVPPLRARKEDIAPLANHFLERFLSAMNKPVFSFTSDHVARLVAYAWPGNVRELQNIVERFAISSTAGMAQLELVGGGGANAEPFPVAKPSELADEVMTEDEMVRLQIRNIENALKKCNGKIYGERGAAALLGLKPTTLSTRIKALQIKRPAR